MDSTKPVPDFSSRPRSSSRHWRVVGTLIALLVAGIYAWTHRHGTNGSIAKAARPSNAESEGVLVSTAVAKRQDVPFYLEGLGRVRALNTVLVRSQVDGQISDIQFKEGQEVHAGDLLVQIDPRAFQAAVEQAEAKRAQDVAQRDSARRVHAGNVPLLAKGALDQQSFDIQQAVMSQLEALVQADEAAVAVARLQLEHTRITSPIDGRAGLRLVDRGNLVRASDPAGLVVINQFQPVAVTFTLPERSLARISRGLSNDDTPAMSALALDRDNQEILETGALSAIDNQIDETSGTVRCKALFPNQNLRLWPGQFVNVRILTETRKAALTIPTGGVQQGANGSYAYVVRSNLTVEVRPVEIALIENGLAVIDRGLALGETVVIDGQYSLHADSPVRIKNSSKP